MSLRAIAKKKFVESIVDKLVVGVVVAVLIMFTEAYFSSALERQSQIESINTIESQLLVNGIDNLQNQFVEYYSELVSYVSLGFSLNEEERRQLRAHHRSMLGYIDILDSYANQELANSEKFLSTVAEVNESLIDDSSIDFEDYDSLFERLRAEYILVLQDIRSSAINEIESNKM